jgi:NAD(P)-dependent dehydrogenase (short-subunit alcohol dehydrogenase family)
MADSNTKTALLTGAASEGIGVAVLKRLLADGYRVIGTYEREDASRAAALEGELEGLSLQEVDHADRDSLESFLEAASGNRVDLLVNAQFFFAMETSASFDFDQWDRSLAVNLSAPAFLYHGLRSAFAEQASVVSVTSTEAFAGSFGASAYAATKAAMHNLTMSLANLGGPDGVRVNAVAAGWIGGVMDTDEVFNMSRSITPLGRLGSPDEVAACVAFLASTEAAFVNGSVLVADGGYLGVDSISKFEFEAEQSSLAQEES